MKVVSFDGWELIFSPLKKNAWNTIPSFQNALFSGALNLLGFLGECSLLGTGNHVPEKSQKKAGCQDAIVGKMKLQPHYNPYSWEPKTFIFRSYNGYNPYIGGFKSSCFMVLGSKGLL